MSFLQQSAGHQNEDQNQDKNQVAGWESRKYGEQAVRKYTHPLAKARDWTRGP